MRGNRLQAVLCLLVLTATGVAGIPAGPSAAYESAPPGEPAGSGQLQGTESVLDEQFTGAICFRTTKSIFALRGIGTYHGRTADGEDVIYRAEAEPGEPLYASGPLHVEVEATETYYHGPNGTHGTADASCTPATVNSPIPAEFRIFAADHVYRLDGAAQVPCVGHGTFARSGPADDPNWHAEWRLDTDCTVVGNEAGVPGIGVAPAVTAHTHAGVHAPCFSAPCPDNINADYRQYLPFHGLHVSVVGPASAQVGSPATITAVVTDDGQPVPNAPVTFAVTGPSAGAPPGGAAVTASTGQASFTFTAGAAGAYTVSASATNGSDTASGAHTVTFTPPSPAAMTLDGPARWQTEENLTVTATYTTAAGPTSAAPVDFAVTGPGQATPASATAPTDNTGKARFTFAADRAGDYTVTASTSVPGHEASAGRGVHLDINTFRRVDALSLESGGQLRSAVVDPAGDYAYFGATSTIVKIDLKTFQAVGSLATSGVFRSAVIDPAGAYAYFGTDSSPGRVVKVDLRTFEVVDTLTLNTGENRLGAAVIDPAGTYAYFGTANPFSPVTYVIRIDLSTFQRVGAIALEGGENTIESAIMDPTGTHAYFGAEGDGSGPGRVVKVQLSTFQRVGAVTMVGTDEHGLSAAAMDPGGDYAYFGTRSSPGRVVKIDLDTFQRVAAIQLAPGEDSIGMGVVDTNGRYAYFGTSLGSPTEFIKVDLTTFDVVHRIALPLGENKLYAGVLSPAGDFLYAGGLNDLTALRSFPTVIKMAVSRPPVAWLVAGDDAYTTDYLTPLTEPAPGVLGNDTDQDNDPLTAHNASDPAGGTVDLNPDGSFTYTPDEGFAGTDTFTYVASDGMDYSAPATVTITVEDPEGLTGGAYGFSSSVSLFGGPAEPRGPAPSVTLPPEGSATPVTATAPTGDAVYGPAQIFTSGQLDVSTEGSSGPGGSVASSTKVANVNRGGSEVFTAAEVTSTCDASPTGASASTRITGGTLRVSEGDPNVDGDDTVVTIPADPAPNTTYEGALETVGDRFRYVFNEQITNPDGTITVYAAHQYLLGPTAVGDLYIGKATCGVPATSTDPPTLGVVADFDGDGDTDVSVFRPADGTWYAQGSAQANYGVSGDIAVPADYDGDGKSDVAVFRPSDGVWYVKGSAGTDTAVAFGASGDIPVPADYDGDAKADIAVFRDGVWYVKGSAGVDTAVAFGASGDVPVPADYDGDAKADMAVFRDGVWYVKGSAGTDFAVAFGTAGDIAVPGDYDGNGTTEVAVFRPANGVWFVQGGAATAWGTSGDLPVPGDYDGDGDVEIAVFRPSNGVWFVQGGATTAWGANGDVPLPLPAAVYRSMG